MDRPLVSSISLLPVALLTNTASQHANFNFVTRSILNLDWFGRQLMISRRRMLTNLPLVPHPHDQRPFLARTSAQSGIYYLIALRSSGTLLPLPARYLLGLLLNSLGFGNMLSSAHFHLGSSMTILPPPPDPPPPPFDLIELLRGGLGLLPPPFGVSVNELTSSMERRPDTEPECERVLEGGGGGGAAERGDRAPGGGGGGAPVGKLEPPAAAAAAALLTA